MSSNYPSRALFCGTRWIGSAILLVSVMLLPAEVVPARAAERARW